MIWKSVPQRESCPKVELKEYYNTTAYQLDIWI